MSRRPGPKSSKVSNSKLKRSEVFEHQVYSDILQSQQTDFNGDFADTVLICDGGTIRIHAFLLQAASPFIQKAIFSQGENYPYVREILLPDFSVKEIQPMLDLIYKGYTYLKNNREVETLKETLEFFNVEHVNFNCKEKWNRIEGSLKVQDLNRIPQDVAKKEERRRESNTPEIEVVTVPPRKAKVTRAKVAKPDPTPRRTLRARKTVLKNTNEEISDDDSSNSSESEEKPGRPTTRGKPLPTKKAQPVVRLNRLANPSPARSSSSIQTVSTSTSSTTAPAQSTSSAPKTNEASNSKQDFGEDDEDASWRPPNYKDLEWFSAESRKCQTCNKSFEKAADASLCVTSHKSLRCYFCFRVYTTTDALFKHFSSKHKPAGRESTLICPFCDQAVPYKSVSCHVISVHLRTKPEDEKEKVSSKCKPIVAACIPQSTSSVTKRSVTFSGKTEGSPPPKKVKSEEYDEKPVVADIKRKKKKKRKLVHEPGKLKVSNLDMTVEKVTSRGRTLVFRLRKERPPPIISYDTIL